MAEIFITACVLSYFCFEDIFHIVKEKKKGILVFYIIFMIAAVTVFILTRMGIQILSLSKLIENIVRIIIPWL